ncbi:glycohydrolase toxin TNT-related protein [Actinoplanes awajinensis]|uniref:glycohydrolase toxin TNT-related protein n=1 Tax=Actinoplanes awajinensis TaxID=135946 RepID=UPI000A067EF8|nr:glycohydrolase toxin TNT-related protein [Actinoplanes awajinensis]
MSPSNPGRDNYRYLVTGDIPVRAGVTGPAFGQPGGAAMFKLDPGVPGAPPLLTVRWLVRVGLLRPVVEQA